MLRHQLLTPQAAPAEPQGTRVPTDTAADSADIGSGAAIASMARELTRSGCDAFLIALRLRAVRYTTLRGSSMLTGGRGRPMFTIQARAFSAADHIAEFAGNGES